MKTLSPILVAAVLAFGAAPVSAQQTDSAFELEALASGYAAAFQRLYQSHTLTVVMKRDGRTIVLKDVRKLEAVAGVLVVSVGSSGDKFIVNPRDIVFVTDAARYPSLDEPRG